MFKSVFNQGDEGHSWYIIQKGSVDVVIHGKGIKNLKPSFELLFYNT